MIRAARIAWLELRRDIAMGEIRKARAQGIISSRTVLDWADQVDAYTIEIDRLQGMPSRELIAASPPFVDSLGSTAPRVPRRSLVDATDGIFRGVIVGIALLFVLLLAWHLSPLVAARLFGA